MEPNILAVLLAAFSTIAIGFIWYHPKVFGKIWMREAGMTTDKLKGTNMLLLLGMSVFYAFLMSFILSGLVIHQFGATAMINNDIVNAKPSYSAFMADYGTAFRTFKHGMLHGFITGLLLATPIIGTNALYERKSWRYTLVNGGFWIASLTLMGGIICAWM